jgi:UDP-glucose 4-epimerase
VANSHQIKIDLGWTPQFNKLNEILRHAWNWEQQNFIAQQGQTS